MMINIILVNYNSSQDTINCIESIYKFNKFFQCHIQITDNNSNQNDKEKLNAALLEFNSRKNPFILSVEFFYNQENSGFASANNYWINKAPQNDILWILNNDTLVNENLLSKINENLPADNEICYMDCHTFNDEYHDSGLHYVNLKTGQSRMEKKSAADFEYICGASFLIKKTENTPLFDESYFLYYEDCDYGMLLKNKGYIYKKIPNCYFLHKIGGKKENRSEKMEFIMLRSQVLFMKRYCKNYGFYFIAKFLYLILKKRDFKSAANFIKFSFSITSNSHFQSC